MATNLMLAVDRFDPAQPDYESLVVHRESIEATQNVESVFARLRERPLDYLPVIRGGEVVGMLPGAQLSGLMGAKFSFALYARRPVECLQLQPLTAIQGTCDVIKLLDALFVRDESSFHHDVALLNHSGAYVGMIPIQVFAKLQSRLLSERLHELEIAKDAALASTRAKTRFLANMSHELRTPLNGIMGFADLLLETPLDAEQEDFVSTIRNSGQSLLHLVSDVLAVTSAQQGNINIRTEAFDLVAVLQEVTGSFSDQARLKTIKLELEILGRPPWTVLGDAVRLKQAISTLVGNAVKFTANGRVTVRACKLQQPPHGTAQIEIVDTGIGISEEQLKRVFEAFAQGDDSATRSYGGAGIGLCLCRHLVQAMGGRIEVSSQLGIGTAFRLNIPWTLQASAAA